VDRATRYLIAARLSDRKAATYNSAIISAFRAEGLPVHTMTVDNGMEFAEFPRLEKALKTVVYFAHAYHAWERGTNENTNGLLRQFFPKGTDFSGVNPRGIQQVVDLLNNRPRKCLGYRTPVEAIEAMLCRI
jgi:IS30 family transposase